MLVPRFTQERCLILSDTDAESLLAAAMASEQQAISSNEPSLLVPAWWQSDQGMELDLVISAIEPALKQQGTVYALMTHDAQAFYPPEEEPCTGLALHAHQTRLLTDAAYFAMQLGFRRLVWPIRIPEDHPDRISAIGTAIDRAMLVSRLVSLDATTETAPGIQIETPFVDLSDAQMLDLVADLALPLETCWWANARTLPYAQQRAQSWNQPDTRNATQLEPKPGIQSPT